MGCITSRTSRYETTNSEMILAISYKRTEEPSYSKYDDGDFAAFEKEQSYLKLRTGQNRKNEKFLIEEQSTNVAGNRLPNLHWRSNHNIDNVNYKRMSDIVMKCIVCSLDRQRGTEFLDKNIRTSKSFVNSGCCGLCFVNQQVGKNNNFQSFGKRMDVMGAISATAAFANLFAKGTFEHCFSESDLNVKKRRNTWVQLAGHPGAFAPAGPHTIWKRRLSKENCESKAYLQLMEDRFLVNFVPKFYRVVENNGDTFIELEDLLENFDNPSIMDVKMGTRTFLESEVTNPVLRKDLYEKMVAMDENEPSAEEHQQKAITKLRYMQFRERESSTSSLGFRIDALKMSEKRLETNLKKMKEKEQVIGTFTRFFGGEEAVKWKAVKRLKQLRDGLEKSEFFKKHGVIGGSILILWDKHMNVGAWMIDFGKTYNVLHGNIINHRSPWEPFNNEDGYLLGVDNLIEVVSASCPMQRISSNSSLVNS